jgi:hypothetical protein
MLLQPRFAVSRFKYRKAVLSFRVDGDLNGVRIRRNCKSREDAAAGEKPAFNSRRFNWRPAAAPSLRGPRREHLRESAENNGQRAEKFSESRPSEGLFLNFGAQSNH